jgi:hypothetical protein
MKPQIEDNNIIICDISDCKNTVSDAPGEINDLNEISYSELQKILKEKNIQMLDVLKEAMQIVIKRELEKRREMKKLLKIVTQVQTSEFGDKR